MFLYIVYLYYGCVHVYWIMYDGILPHDQSHVCSHVESSHTLHGCIRVLIMRQYTIIHNPIHMHTSIIEVYNVEKHTLSYNLHGCMTAVQCSLCHLTDLALLSKLAILIY